MSRISSRRFVPPNPIADLGLLGDLAGTWFGTGFNLIARPDFEDKTDLYLQLNETVETLQFIPIGSPIPNRGFGQNDINLHGLTYLQKIENAGDHSALHIEPGIWVTQPNTTFPPDTAPGKGQLVARMGTIPHGNSLLAQGIAEKFKGPPVLKTPGSQYAFSRFPSFNSTPFGVPPTAPNIVINAAGTSEKLAAAAIPPVPNFPPPPPGFPQYDMSVPVGPIAAGPLNPPFALNTRTPYGSNPPAPAIPSHIPSHLPPPQVGVPIQTVVNDPISILQQEIQHLVDTGHEFEGTVLNIATQASINFLTTPNSPPAGPSVTVTVPQFSGGIDNIRFLSGNTVAAGNQTQLQENAEAALVYATFWIQKVTHKPTGRQFMQLQYAQTVVLNFPVFLALHPTPPIPSVYVNLGWPHISVATLRRTFG